MPVYLEQSLPTSQKQKTKIRNVLDIGTGTGVLSLMCAQNNPNAVIDAIEIDADPFQPGKRKYYILPHGIEK